MLAAVVFFKLKMISSAPASKRADKDKPCQPSYSTAALTLGNTMRQFIDDRMREILSREASKFAILQLIAVE